MPLRSKFGISGIRSLLPTWLVRTLQAALGLAVLAWLLHSGAIDWRAIRRLLTSAWVIPTAVGLCLGNFAFMAWRLRVLMEAQDLVLPYSSAFRLTVVAAFFSWCIPGGTGGDLVKLYFLGHWNRGRITEAVTITLLDRAVGLATLLMLALVAAALMPSPLASGSAISALLAFCATCLATGVACVALALYRDWTTQWPLCELERFGWPGRTILRVLRVVHGYRRRPAALAGSVAISLCAQSCLLATAFVVAGVVAPDGPRPVMLVLMPMGFIANALPVTPGGLGVGEAAFEKLFSLAGLSGGAAVSLAWRALAMAVSLLGLWYYLRIRSEVPLAVADGLRSTSQAGPPSPQRRLSDANRPVASPNLPMTN